MEEQFWALPLKFPWVMVLRKLYLLEHEVWSRLQNPGICCVHVTITQWPTGSRVQDCVCHDRQGWRLMSQKLPSLPSHAWHLQIFSLVTSSHWEFSTFNSFCAGLLYFIPTGKDPRELEAGRAALCTYSLINWPNVNIYPNQSLD